MLDLSILLIWQFSVYIFLHEINYSGIFSRSYNAREFKHYIEQSVDYQNLELLYHVLIGNQYSAWKLALTFLLGYVLISLISLFPLKNVNSKR